ncbi:hypothetical protein PIB30_030358 [Stylosanthes scabra]|uniref:Uncharacterized protein n=1 Tax=Stylosanthes scabra TaxID=79078 RepID=A0ABU6V9L8_9FABA|nr:hypothetical protein [Stylosanthes scabra]
MKNNNKEEHQDSRNVLLQAVLNEWDKEDLQLSVRKVVLNEGTNYDKQNEGGQYEGEDDSTSSHVHSSDLDETLNHMWEVHCKGSKRKKKKQKISEIIRNKMTNEDVKDGYEVLDKENDNYNVIEVVQVKEFDKTKCRGVSNFDFEMGDYEDGQDLMAILKEQNEALDLKRRKAKQKEKARKSRPKNKKLN